MQCNAGKRGRRKKREGEGERERGEGMAWGDRPGRIDMGSYTLKSPHHPAPDSARSADESNMASVTPPILHSPFTRHTWHRSRSIPSCDPLLNSISFLLLLHILSAYSLPRYLYFSCSSSSDSSHCYLILSVPFSLSYPSSISPHEPYLHEAVPPRCFNHLYLFQFSALFFSQPFRSDRRGFHLNPLSTYMRGDASGDSPHASPYHFRLPLQSLTQPKRARALGLPAFLHHHVNPPKAT